jgi:hypothetical protein
MAENDDRQPSSATHRGSVPRRRDWTAGSLKPVIARFEAPLEIEEAHLAQVTNLLQGMGDGAIIYQGTLGLSGTGSLTGSFPPDADGDIDGSIP